MKIFEHKGLPLTERRTKVVFRMLLPFIISVAVIALLSVALFLFVIRPSKPFKTLLNPVTVSVQIADTEATNV